MVGFLHLSFSVWVTTVTLCGFIQTSTNNCLNVKDYYWKHLTSKTPYRFVANHNDSEIRYEGCVPKKIWAVVRHGTRYPNAKYINRMNSRLTEIRDVVRENTSQKATLCAQHMHNITQWTSQIDLADEKRLTHVGEDEMVELAERFQKRFPTLLGIDYNNSSFEFRSTATQRTIQSKFHFTIGLFGRRIAHHVWSPEPISKDPILRFYKLCKKWVTEVDKNPKAKLEVNKFTSSEEVQKVIKHISLRLGLEELSFEDVELIYITCCYESSRNRVTFSPWCSVFSEEDMEVMEFLRDLKYYWTSGYGHDINFKQACPLMEDFIQHVQSEDGPHSRFYFTHSGTLLKFLSHLGLYYDEFKLTSDKFKTPRLWKVGYMDAFGGNLAFVTFQCGDEKKVLTLHQERPVKLPGCPKDGLCRFDKILKTLMAETVVHKILRLKCYCFSTNWLLKEILKWWVCDYKNLKEGILRFWTDIKKGNPVFQIMAADHDKINLIKIVPEVPSYGITRDTTLSDFRNEHISNTKVDKTFSKGSQDGGRGVAAKETIVVNEAAEERQRNGRYLAIGVTLVMLFIAFYHTLLRHVTFLAGLLAPAIIMLLYILWLFYFAKKNKPQVSTV